MTAYLHPASLLTPALLAQCEVRRQRRSGPGGQHRNKVETAIVLVHSPTGIIGQASERRSQAENMKVALHRLRVKLALGVRSPADDSAGLSPLWQSRVRSGQITVSATNADFPGMLVEALDVIAACNFDCKAGGDLLACSSSQLVKFLKIEPEALMYVNVERRQRDLRSLR